MNNENRLILYKDDKGKVNVNVRFADEDVWLTQQQLAEIYYTTKQNVSQHIDNILADGELEENRTVKNFLTVRQEGNRQVQRDITYYNLNIIITCAITCGSAFPLLINPANCKNTSNNSSTNTNFKICRKNLRNNYHNEVPFNSIYS